jgi:ACDE family multidrug resistance protein
MKTRGLTVNRQMLYLFFSSFSILCVGFGLFPLLPIYAGRYGATPTTIGLYLALTYVSITLGTLLAGWLSGRAPRRLTQTLAGFTGVLALAGLGQADALWQVMLLTGLVWFTGGVGLANIDVMTGLLTNRANRGKSFSWIALTNPLGAIMGSLLVGQLVEWKGYPVMFAVLAAEYAIWPLIGLFLLQDQPVQARRADQSTSTTAAGPNRIFHFLLLSLLLSAMSISVERLGLSLQMKALDYSASAITGANVIGGLVTIPVVLWFGKLSDRLGRKMFLLSGYLLAALGGVTLLMAGHLWHFWLVAAATLIARSISASVASALATDILPPEAIGRSLPWVGTTSWIAGVVGFAASGFVIDLAGVASLFAIATLLSIGAASLVSRLPSSIPVLALQATRTRATASPAPCGATDIPPL